MDSPQQPSPSSASPTYAKRLSQIQRIQVRTLVSEEYSYVKISQRLGIPWRQVQYTMSVENTKPQYSNGRPSILSSSQVNEIESFIRLSLQNRWISFFQLAHFIFRHFGVSENVIQRELAKRRYARKIARLKPPISTVNKLKRYEFPRINLHWRKKHWMRVLWSDETWALDGRPSDRWVTRKIGEEYEEISVLAKTRRGVGWMFWGSFFGQQKGPCLIWKKEWGYLTAASYCERIGPLIDSVVIREPGLDVMQDNAPPHKSRRTMREFERRNISLMEWPPYSPDLDPIETVRSYVKAYTERLHPALDEGRQRSQGQLRRMVNEAWGLGFNGNDLEKLIDSMPRRIRAVYEAEGGYGNY